MAKAQYHKNQRVYVRPVGTWALVERVLPQWAKGLDEPIRVFYDVGLGREFGADELQSEQHLGGSLSGSNTQWRIVRARNKWQQPEDCAHHPHPGTYPVVMTGETDWGGWRVPGSEYDLHPHQVEGQARLISNAPHLYGLAKALKEFAAAESDNLPQEALALAKRAENLLKLIDSES
ncbi:MAG TPA: hypothetical protein PLA85_03190 [Micropepsaceae bacterium]|nr:hypothetical protein [Micropepsaceae bacterium]HRK70565.1 hypothetical protein [Micropepsaceae bacterium]